jgi:hypothetical protein
MFTLLEFAEWAMEYRPIWTSWALLVFGYVVLPWTPDSVDKAIPNKQLISSLSHSRLFFGKHGTLSRMTPHAPIRDWASLRSVAVSLTRRVLRVLRVLRVRQMQQEVSNITSRWASLLVFAVGSMFAIQNTDSPWEIGPRVIVVFLASSIVYWTHRIFVRRQAYTSCKSRFGVIVLATFMTLTMLFGYMSMVLSFYFYKRVQEVKQTIGYQDNFASSSLRDKARWVYQEHYWLTVEIMLFILILPLLRIVTRYCILSGISRILNDPGAHSIASASDSMCTSSTKDHRGHMRIDANPTSIHLNPNTIINVDCDQGDGIDNEEREMFEVTHTTKNIIMCTRIVDCALTFPVEAILYDTFSNANNLKYHILMTLYSSLLAFVFMHISLYRLRKSFTETKPTNKFQIHLPWYTHLSVLANDQVSNIVSIEIEAIVGVLLYGMTGSSNDVFYSIASIGIATVGVFFLQCSVIYTGYFVPTQSFFMENKKISLYTLRVYLFVGCSILFFTNILKIN